ncbi:MAG TPA: glycosyltransferase family 9 protein [Solirubrobacteraceae bacterium]|nr:glycosyltransferase family 9 protein [Solirubrobacteraceae bacterium]
MTHVLVARLDNDGDVLLAGPAVRAVAAGADRVTLLCGPRGARAAELLPGVDAILTRRADWIDPEPLPFDRAAGEAWVAELEAVGADRAIVLGSFHQSPLPLALLLRMAGVTHVAATSVDFPGSLLDVRHRIDDDVHEVERSLDLVRTLGYKLPPGDDGALAVHRTGRRPDALGEEPYVVVHPGASVPARAWTPWRHAALVEALSAVGRRAVVTGAPSECDLTARVAGADGLDLGGKTSLADLAEVLAGADAVVVGNTGPAHLAAAVGTPVGSLFAPTVPAARWRPWRVGHALLYLDVPCAGCRARRCPVAGHPCLNGVDVEEVLAAIEQLAPADVQAVPA